MAELPSGTVTFLFTDLEGSTRRWEEQPEAMRAALADHDALLSQAIESRGGHVVKSTGDGVFAVFADPSAAVAAAVEAQQAFGADAGQSSGALRVRMGLHVGSATVQDGDYVGTEVNRTARLMSIAHGGQIVCSRPVRDLVGDRFTLTDLGEHRLRDLSSSVHVFQVEAPGLASDFPPLRSLTAGSGNLPRQMTTFVGRAAEIAAVSKLVRASALVTLTGVGGVGKTRLALQVTADLSADYRDGAWCSRRAPGRRRLAAGVVEEGLLDLFLKEGARNPGRMAPPATASTCSSRPSARRSTDCRSSPGAATWRRPRPCSPGVSSTSST